jgi:hypothetical protein
VAINTPEGTSNGDEIKEVLARFRFAKRPEYSMIVFVPFILHMIILPMFWYILYLHIFNVASAVTFLWLPLTTPQQKLKLRKVFLPCITRDTLKVTRLTSGGATTMQSKPVGAM